MKYSDALHECRKAERLTESPEDELDNLDELPELEDAPETEVEVPVIELGMQVNVIDADSFVAEDLGLSEDDFEEFKAKVEEKAYAIVYDINDDDDTIVNIVFEDGMEVENIPKINLVEIDEEEPDPEY